MPRLLIVKTSSLGDVIHNLPVITDAHRHIPGLTVDWVVEESFSDIPALHPGVARVIPVAVRRWRKNLLSRQTWREVGALRQTLQAQAYDWVLDTQGLLKSAAITAMARGVRHGQDRVSAREPLAALFYAVQHPVARGQHAVTRNRLLASQALGYALDDVVPDYGVSLPRLPEVDVAPYVIGLHGTSRDSKLWPVEHWVALGQALHEKGLKLRLPWGNPAEQARAVLIAASVPGAEVLAKQRLGELAAVLGKATAAVGVDTGLVHLAVALDVPTVAIYTDTDPALTGVLGGRNARCRNLGGVGQIPMVEEVLASLSPLLSAAS